MNRGFTYRWRKRWDKGYHTDVYLWLLMDYFIDFANHKKTTVYFPGSGLITLERGQHIFGYRKVSEFLNIGMSMCVRKIKLLETIGFMTITATNKYSIASIINYDTYQSYSHDNDKQNGKQSESVAESNRKAIGKQSELPNKDNNGNKVNNTKKARAWPNDFCLDDSKREYALKNGIDPNRLEDFFSDFKDWSLSKGATYKDWDAAFRTRVRRAQEYGKTFLLDKPKKTEYEKWLEKT